MRTVRGRVEDNLGRKIYRIHACDKCIISGSVILRSDEHAVSLCSSEIDHLCLSWLSVDTINFDNGHVVTLEPEILTSKSSDVDDAEHVSLAGLKHRGHVLSVVHQCCIRNWLSSCGVCHVDKDLHQIWHLIMIPIRESQGSLLVVLSLVWGVGVVDDKRASKSIWILSRYMGMIPVRSRLFDLLRSVLG